MTQLLRFFELGGQFMVLHILCLALLLLAIVRLSPFSGKLLASGKNEAEAVRNLLNTSIGCRMVAGCICVAVGIWDDPIALMRYVVLGNVIGPVWAILRIWLRGDTEVIDHTSVTGEVIGPSQHVMNRWVFLQVDHWRWDILVMYLCECSGMLLAHRL